MKRICLTLLIMILCVSSASAHPGRTDAEGGHYDQSTGEYHYHHGHPAHQHPNGTCPYDFDDRTGENSGTSGSSGGSENQQIENTPSNGAETHTAKKDWIEFIKAGVAILFLTPIGWFVLELLMELIGWIFGKTMKASPHRVDYKPPAQMKEQKQKRISDTSDAIKYTEMREMYRDLYEGKSVWEVAGVPKWAYFGADGLPHTISGTHEADAFAVYITKNGGCYHRKECRMAKSAQPVNLCTALERRKTPCKTCKPISELPQFVNDYHRLQAICANFKIDMRP